MLPAQGQEGTGYLVSAKLKQTVGVCCLEVKVQNSVFLEYCIYLPSQDTPKEHNTQALPSHFVLVFAMLFQCQSFLPPYMSCMPTS